MHFCTCKVANSLKNKVFSEYSARKTEYACKFSLVYFYSFDYNKFVDV